MNEELIARLSRRYIALDIHKHYSVVAGVNFEGQVILEPARIEHADLEAWLEKHIQATDYVVIESTTNVWHIYDLLEPLAEKVLVANPIKVKQIAQVRVKTDIRDTLVLARMLAANMIPAIWVPPVHVRNLRYQLELDVSTKNHLDEQARKITEKLSRMSHQKPWAESMLYLMQLPGFGVITEMTVLAAIGEITRFETFKKLSGYSGLTPGVEQSGVKNRGKGITKEGRKDLRWAMVEVAQRAVKSDPLWERRFQELCRRMHRNQAIVVIAHRLLELVWFVLTRKQSYRHFSDEWIAYKYLTWAWQINENDRDGLTRQQFARYYLMRLGIGHGLDKVALDPKHPRRLASEAEILALRPELTQTE
jgi:transposase